MERGEKFSQQNAVFPAGYSHISTPGVRAPPCYSPAASQSREGFWIGLLGIGSNHGDSLSKSGALQGDGSWERCCFLIARRQNPTKANPTQPNPSCSGSFKFPDRKKAAVGNTSTQTNSETQPIRLNSSFWIELLQFLLT